jgi:hypothetical protein
MEAAIAVVMQIPLQVPVFKRELMNKMYHPFTYLSARFTSNYIF